MSFVARPVSAVLFAFVCLDAQTPDVPPEQFFETRVRPALASRCYSCHTGAQSGGLRLDSREAALKGGKSGPALLPGKPEESLLIAATTYKHARLKMPPAEKLEDTEISALTDWVRSGAVWPESKVPVLDASKGYQITEKQKAFWSFQPVRLTQPPAARLPAWRKNPVDAYILAKLNQRKLIPAGRADKRTLLRRATLDLTGLLPTPVEMDRFLADNSRDAFEKVVDRLLASPRYGERWGRHWLDIARYSDTAGDASDYPIPQAYLYRDWVIDAFNNDKPYDEFIREQIAGDLMRGGSEPENWQRTVATGYLALARRFNVNPKENMHMTYD